jgi:hypothetical protein
MDGWASVGGSAGRRGERPAWRVQEFRPGLPKLASEGGFFFS